MAAQLFHADRLLLRVCWECKLMCCGVVSLCQTADELQVVCVRHGLTNCVISPVSHTFMPFTHNHPFFLIFLPSRHWELKVSLTFQSFSGNHKRSYTFDTFNFQVQILKTTFFISWNYYFLFFFGGSCRTWPHLWSPLWLAETWRRAAAAERAHSIFKVCNSHIKYVREASLRRPVCLTLIQWPPCTHTHIFFVK